MTYHFGGSNHGKSRGLPAPSGNGAAVHRPDPGLPPAVPFRWYILYTAPRFEEKVAARLGKEGLGTYLPMASDWRWPSPLAKKRGKKRERVERVLLPRYLFVSLPFCEHRTPFGVVTAVDGALSFVSNAHGPLEVRGEAVEEIKRREARGEFNRTRLHRLRNRAFVTPRWVRAGAEVEIQGGALASFVGKIIAVLPQERVEIETFLFGTARKAVVDIDQIAEIGYLSRQIEANCAARVEHGPVESPGRAAMSA